MRPLLVHKECKGRIAVVLPETAFFCLSPNVSPLGTSVSLGEIGKFSAGKLSVVRNDAKFVPVLVCLECSSVLTERDSDDILIECNCCGKNIAVSVAITTRGYSCVCEKCLKLEKKPRSSLSSKKLKEPGIDISPYTSTSTGRWIGSKKSDTFIPTPLAESLFGKIRVRR